MNHLEKIGKYAVIGLTTSCLLFGSYFIFQNRDKIIKSGDIIFENKRGQKYLFQFNEYENRVVYFTSSFTTNISLRYVDYNKDGCFEEEIISGFARVGGGFIQRKNLENKLCIK